ncbi:hypothetical protein Ae201684P_010724 [Aphanomyces euteiches]|nr:hypothetical protein Ae201684P_010724 [Aphanomyces euteiches]
MKEQSAPTPGQPNSQQIKPIDQAIRLIQQAVEQDRNANFVLAFRLYMQSFEYFMVANEHEAKSIGKKIHRGQNERIHDPRGKPQGIP